MKNIKFYIDPKNTGSIETPFFLLSYDNWDDYSRKTSFGLSYYDNDRKRTPIGYVKIMHEDQLRTLDYIDKEFEELSEEFCSLGQNIEYYSALYDLLEKDKALFEEVLHKINDVAFLSALGERFEHNSNFRVSLIRNSEALKAFKEAKSIIYDLPQNPNFIFTYKCNLENTEGEHKVDFNFGDNKDLPNRMISLIGKNGTGKTQFLAKFALDLSGQSKSKLKNETFTPSRPLFSKVIAVSYSAFDKFTRPKKDKSFSYKYCGLKDEDGRLLSGPKLVENYRESVGLILSQHRNGIWYEVMKTILDEGLADLFYDEIFIKENFEIVDNKTSKLLSSGQSFLMYVITEVLAHIKRNSILLFDEPEMHLHPNAIANFVRMLELILNKFDSYAILATHSPIILQEIPARYVYVFERQGNVPMVYNLGFESFGENIDVLTEKVFKTMEVEDNYKSVLKNLSKEYPYKKVLSLFENKLSLSAKTFLLNQYENPEIELNA
ncbi:MAG: AAA family ATPase [Flavobacterium sp.]